MNRTLMQVAVVGRGAGVVGPPWAARGHQVYGADTDEAHITAARMRSREAGFGIVFELAQTSALPWPDRSMDLCIVPEVPGDAADWRGYLAECVRILRPGGALRLGAIKTSWLTRYRLRKRLARHGLTILGRSNEFGTTSGATLVAIKPAF